MANQTDYKKMSRVLSESAVELSGDELSFKVRYWGAVPRHFDNPLHRHSFFEVCYVVDGEGAYLESGAEFPLGAGTLFCSRPGQWHRILSRDGLDLLFVAFEVDENRSREAAASRYLHLLQHNKIVVPAAQRSSAARLWLALAEICTQEHALVRETIRSTACALLLSFYAEFSSAPENGRQPDGRPVSAYLQRAKLFIEDNLALALSLGQVSEYLYITKRHLSRIFAEQAGQSFAHYIQERRVQKSIELLLETDWTIGRIAAETGFASVHYFTRVFTRKLGVPPGKFRESRLSELHRS